MVHETIIKLLRPIQSPQQPQAEKERIRNSHTRIVSVIYRLPRKRTGNKAKVMVFQWTNESKIKLSNRLLYISNYRSIA